MNVEEETSCADPQFRNLLETCLQMEVKQSVEALQSLKRELNHMKYQLKLSLDERKELKDKTKHAQDGILTLTDTLKRLHMQRHESSQRIELMKLNVDDNYKITSLEWQKYDDILDQYKQNWDSFHAKYQEFPLAKVRQEVKIQLQNLRAEKMIVQQTYLALTKVQPQRGQVTWLQMRGKIIQFAKVMLNRSKNQWKLMDLRENFQYQRDQWKSIDIELSSQMKKIEEEKKKRALEILQMPPPKVNFSCIRSIYSSRQQMGLTEKCIQNLEDSLERRTIFRRNMCRPNAPPLLPIRPSLASERPTNQRALECMGRSSRRSYSKDSSRVQNSCTPVQQKSHPTTDCVSIDTTDLEELCQTDDDIIEIPNVRPPQATTSRCSTSFEFRRTPSISRTTEEVCKQNTPKVATEPTPKSVTVQEHDVEEEVERSSQRDHEDKQEETTYQRSFASVRMDSRLSKHKNEEAMLNEIQAKRMKPIEENIRASVIKKTPPKNNRQEMVKSCSMKRSPGPKITKIETIRYNVSPITKFTGDVGPSSMFNPRNYEFCDASNISFAMEHDRGSLKGDEISLYDGPLRDFSDSCNMSPPIGDVDMNSRTTNVENSPSIDARRSFSHLNFFNILKNTGNDKRLF